MSAETVAYSTLAAAGAVTAIVSTRIYPDAVPELIPLPSIAINRDTTDYTATIHSGLPVAVMAHTNIECMSTSRANADAIADVCVTALASAGFYVQDRITGYVDEVPNKLWATILKIAYWEL